MTNEGSFLAVISSGCDEWWGSDMMWWMSWVSVDLGLLIGV